MASVLKEETKQFIPEAISSRLITRRRCSLLTSGSHGDLQLLSLEMSVFLDLYILWHILCFYTLVGVAWGSPKALPL